MKKWDGRVSLAMKLNLVIVASILISTLGLVMVSASAYRLTIEDAYDEEADIVLERVNDYLELDQVETLIDAFGTKEYMQIHRTAETELNEQRVIDWMQSRQAPDYEGNRQTIRDVYERVYQELYDAAYPSAADRLYLWYEKDGGNYIVAEAYETVLSAGMVHTGDAVPDSPQHDDPVKGTIFRIEDQWYYIKRQEVFRQTDSPEGDPFCAVDVVFDVNSIINSRHLFTLYSLLFSIALIVGVIAVSTWITRKNVSMPLIALSKGATAFGKEDRGYTKDDIISLNINTEDEIEDLYNEIRSMQTRIVNYTENLAAVTAERERVSTELRMASTIQDTMLPNRFPAYPDRKEFDLYASMRPAKEVGGDFYDFFLIDDDHLAMLIADVSEKGVPAALLMMASKILLDYRTKMGGTPGEILAAVNKELAENNESKMFVTVWLGILDIRTGKLICSNAGHEYPALSDETGTFRLFQDEHGLVIGGLSKSSYTDYELTLKPGETIFVYTDGVTDAKSETGEFYGTDRMVAALNRMSGKTPEEILNLIRDDIDAFMGSAQQFDDLTMLCLTYHGPDAAAEPQQDPQKAPEDN